MICILADLFQNQWHQDGKKIQNGNDDDTDACPVDPSIADTPFNPAARFDEMPKTPEQAPFRRDFPLHRPGPPYGA
jgi:hypothetical protein